MTPYNPQLVSWGSVHRQQAQLEPRAPQLTVGMLGGHGDLPPGEEKVAEDVSPVLWVLA